MQTLPEGHDRYWLTNTATGHYDEEYRVFHAEQKREANAWLERQNSRCRWMNEGERERVILELGA